MSKRSKRNTFTSLCLALFIAVSLIFQTGISAEAAGLPSVKNLKLSRVNGTTIKLSWKPVKGATGYIIYRYENSVGNYVALKKLKGTKKTSWSDYNTNANQVQNYGVAAYISKSGVNKKSSIRKVRWNGYSKTYYIAHRGAMDSAPPNTLAAFSKAKQDGYRAFECDVWYTSSKDLLICHEHNLQSITGFNTIITSVSKRTRKDYPIMSEHYEEYPTQYFPTLQEVLAFCAKNNMQVYLHFWPGDPSQKVSTAAIAKATKFIRKYGMTKRAFILSQHPTYIKGFKKYNLNVGWLCRSTSLRTHKQNLLTAAKYKCKFIIYPHGYGVNISTNFIKTCHKKGIRVLFYNIKSSSVAKTFLDKGADNIICNYPVFVE
jgi:glycerophosphoryl diester phosphodiesterase